MPGQTVQTQIRLLLEEQLIRIYQGLQFRLHLLDAILYGKASLFNFRVTTTNFSGVRNFRIFTVTHLRLVCLVHASLIANGTTECGV